MAVASPVVVVWLGYSTIRQCPIQPRLPVLLITLGVFVLLREVLCALNIWFLPLMMYIHFYHTLYTQCQYDLWTMIVFGLHGLLGAIWIFRIGWPDFVNENAYNYCHPNVFLTVMLIVALIIFLGLLWLILFCCFGLRLDTVFEGDPVVVVDPLDEVVVDRTDSEGEGQEQEGGSGSGKSKNNGTEQSN